MRKTKLARGRLQIKNCKNTKTTRELIGKSIEADIDMYIDVNITYDKRSG